jgi:hypothetical protein
MRWPWILGLLVACAKAPTGGLGNDDVKDGGRPADAGGGVGDGGVGPGPDVGPRDAGFRDGELTDAADDIEALISAWAAAECSYLYRCQELSWAFFSLEQPGWDLVTCEARFTARRRVDLAWYRARAAEGLIHDPVPRAEACRHALGAECGIDPREEGRTCDFWQDGRRADGVPCFHGLECESGVCETPSPHLECGRCAARLENGEVCLLVAGESRPRCEMFSYCSGSLGDPGTCTPMASLHQPCFDVLCHGPLVCTVDGPEWSCEPPSGEGAACSGPGDDRCPTERALECRDGRCQRFQPVQPGDPCGPGLRCINSPACDPNTQQCSYAAPVGAACTYPWDCESRYCAAPDPFRPRECLAPKPDEAPCVYASECESSFCGGTPRRCTRPAAWRVCE